jgi:hypothetical protein
VRVGASELDGQVIAKGGLKMSDKLLSMILALMAIAAQAQEFVTDGLVVMYTLDKADIDGDTVKDVSGNNHDATIIGTLKSAEGVIGEALLFERAVNNYVEVPKLGSWEQASIECWARTANLGHDYQGIVSTWQWTAGKVHFKFEGGQIQVHKNDGVKISFNAVADTWYHIVYTADTGANEIKLYVNGELVAEGIAGTTPQNMDERRIGSEHDGRFLDGMVDEVRIYNRVLSEEEVLQNFNVKSNKMAVAPAGKLAATWGHIKQAALIY